MDLRIKTARQKNDSEKYRTMVVGVSCCLLLVGSDIEYWPRSGTGRRQMTRAWDWRPEGG